MTTGRPILIMAGGTGGHIYPALAVARQLLAWGFDVIWLGTRKGLEARIVPAAGIRLEWLSVGGLRGKGWRTRLLAPLRVSVAVAQALIVLLRHRPSVVLGMGGFAAGPGGVAAWLTRRPLVIHEQNSVAGLTNRLLAPLARRVLQGFPGAFARKDAVFTGNPVRADIAALPPPERRFAGRTGPMRVLVLGGSQGARALNETLPAAVAALPQAVRPELWQQSGTAHLDAARHTYDRHGVRARIEPFIEDMAAAYAWADLVIARAGALTVAELAAAGVGAVLAPYPHAVDDHQTDNARFLTDCGAACLVPQEELTPPRMNALLRELNDRNRLLAMACAARAKAMPEAARTVASFCLEAAGNREGAGVAGGAA